MGPIGDRLAASELHHDPYAFFARLRREAPVWRLPGENAYLVSTWDLVAQATSRVQDFSNHFRSTLFSHDDGTLGVLETGARNPDVFAGADPPAHTAHRKIFFSELVQKKIDALEPSVLALTDELLDAMLRGDRFDAAVGLAHPLPMRVIAERIIGFRDPDLNKVRQWVFEGSRLVGGLVTLDQMASLSEEVSGMAPWTTAQLDDAVASSTEGDVLSAAAAGVRNGSLTREEAAFTLMVLVGAGAETTTSLIGNAIGLLAERPLCRTSCAPNRPRCQYSSKRCFGSSLRSVITLAPRLARWCWLASRSPSGRWSCCSGAPRIETRPSSIAHRAHEDARAHEIVRPRPRPTATLGRRHLDPPPRTSPHRCRAQLTLAPSPP